MNRQQTLSLLGILFFAVPMFGQYLQLREKLDNDYVVVQGNVLKFSYEERYAIAVGQNDIAKCRIYNWRHNVLGDNPITLPNQYGLNKQELPLPISAMAEEPCFDYVLEVSGTNKGEVYYLRFKVVTELKVAPKVFLDGPFVVADQKMRDDLRALNLIPLSEPYSGLDFDVQAFGGNPPTTQAVLNVADANNAIVDWVLLELRCTRPTDVPEEDWDYPATSSRAVLVQRDGDVVDVDGVSPVVFKAPPGSYHLVVRHRNHLGAMTKYPYALGINPVTIDLTSSSVETWGTHARKESNGKMTLWAGNTNGDGLVIYQGPNDDYSQIYFDVATDPANNPFNMNHTVSPVYRLTDLNLSGGVNIQGPSNDQATILTWTILSHPLNVNALINFYVEEQLPDSEIY